MGFIDQDVVKGILGHGLQKAVPRRALHRGKEVFGGGISPLAARQKGVVAGWPADDLLEGGQGLFGDLLPVDQVEEASRLVSLDREGSQVGLARASSGNDQGPVLAAFDQLVQGR